MTATTEPLFEAITRNRLLPPSELNRLRERWFKPGRAEANDADKFGRWVVANGFLTAFVVRMLRQNKSNLLRLNQYQLTELLESGQFKGAFLATDPAGRHVIIEVLASRNAADAETLRAYQEIAERALTVQHPNVNRTLDIGLAQGRYFLVRENTEGSTLAEVLSRRGRLQPVNAARLFALALAGLHALHEARVPTGALNENCLILASVEGSGGTKARTVKILHAGVPRSLFDSEALLGNDTLSDPSAQALTPAPVADDLLHLGTVFYRALTGQAPGVGADGKPVPVCRMVADVPEILGEIVDHLVDPDPAQRPRSAAHAAKRLRVFLASEEGAKEERAEDFLAHPAAPPAAPRVESVPLTPTTAVPEPAASAARSRLSELWAELRPSPRELFFLGGGAVAAVLLILLVNLVVGISFVNVVCLLTGGALSFVVEQWLRVREESLEAEG
ncbi:MAG: hypothetical protein FJ271_23335 [Planctomycetes bacterium]|nr:hypothetical protein [Planctomycetota bacterium]